MTEKQLFLDADSRVFIIFGVLFVTVILGIVWLSTRSEIAQAEAERAKADLQRVQAEAFRAMVEKLKVGEGR